MGHIGVGTHRGNAPLESASDLGPSKTGEPGQLARERWLDVGYMALLFTRDRRGGLVVKASAS